jgi:hypothetical protein
MGKIIPFNWLPAAWGLRGKSFDEAEARYNLTGAELARRLAEINLSGVDLEYRLLDIDFEHGLINEYDYQRSVANLSLEGNELLLRLADIDKEFGKIDSYEWMREHILIQTSDDEQKIELIKLDIETGRIDKREGEKAMADLLGEPWVSIVEEGLDPTQGPSGFYFVFDWNNHWIELLRQHGYEGDTEDEMMERWFTDVCRNEVMQSAPIPFNSSVVYD